MGKWNGFGCHFSEEYVSFHHVLVSAKTLNPSLNLSRSPMHSNPTSRTLTLNPTTMIQSQMNGLIYKNTVSVKRQHIEKDGAYLRAFFLGWLSDPIAFCFSLSFSLASKIKFAVPLLDDGERHSLMAETPRHTSS